MKRIFALVCTAGLVAAPAALAQDSSDVLKRAQDSVKQAEKKAQQAVDETTKKVQDAAKAADEAQAAGDEMAAWMQASVPGKHHQMLSTLAGEWDAEIIMIEPGGHAEKFTGTLSSRMEFEGRFLYSQYTGEFGGMPFRGVGVMGFNNVDQRFESFWTDSMSSGMMLAKGTMDESSRTITLHGEHTEPVGKTKVKTREVWTMGGPNKYSIDMFQTRDGEENRVMTITYTRKTGKANAGGDDSKPADSR